MTDPAPDREAAPGCLARIPWRIAGSSCFPTFALAAELARRGAAGS